VSQQPLRRQVESQLDAARAKIQAIQKKIDSLQSQSSHPSSRTTTATKRKATGGLTFLNGTGLPGTPAAYSNNAAYPNQYTHVNGPTMMSTNGSGDASLSSTTTVTNSHTGLGLGVGQSSVGTTPEPGSSRLVSPSPVPQSRSRAKSEGDATARDDYRTALTQANGFVRALLVLARSERARGETSPPADDRGLNGNSVGPPVKPEDSDAELETARLELMTNLVHILARNPRIRWEIQAKELIAGSVLPESPLFPPEPSAQ
jgi:hypothetical protein